MATEWCQNRCSCSRSSIVADKSSTTLSPTWSLVSVLLVSSGENSVSQFRTCFFRSLKCLKWAHTTVWLKLLEMGRAWPFFVLPWSCFDVCAAWRGWQTLLLCCGCEMFWVQIFISAQKLNHKGCQQDIGTYLICEGKAASARHLPILSPSSYQPLGPSQSAFLCPPSVAAGRVVLIRRVYRPWMTIEISGTNPSGPVNGLGGSRPVWLKKKKT